MHVQHEFPPFFNTIVKCERQSEAPFCLLKFCWKYFAIWSTHFWNCIQVIWFGFQQQYKSTKSTEFISFCVLELLHWLGLWAGFCHLSFFLDKAHFFLFSFLFLRACFFKLCFVILKFNISDKKQNLRQIPTALKKYFTSLSYCEILLNLKRYRTWHSTRYRVVN